LAPLPVPANHVVASPTSTQNASRHPVTATHVVASLTSAQNASHYSRPHGACRHFGLAESAIYANGSGTFRRSDLHRLRPHAPRPV
ncbi:MAG TPA: hypothetical protein VFQ54_12070, partial [Thermomicrobiales bacterium]|nr:hypothetical protein [Thermomicrobiales bacterium]